MRTKQAASTKRTKPIKPASHRGLLAALSELYATPLPMTPEEMLAERERVRIDAEREERRQCALTFKATS